MNKTVYKYQGHTYDTIAELRKAMPNVSLPDDPSEEQLTALGVEVATVPLLLQEAKDSKTTELYGDYAIERDRPTEYNAGNSTYYFDRLEADINKFNSAYNVAVIKGENGYGVKSIDGASLWVMLSESDFQSVLIKSASEQSAAYNRFYSLRNKVQNCKTVSAVAKIKWTSKI